MNPQLKLFTDVAILRRTSRSILTRFLEGHQAHLSPDAAALLAASLGDLTFEEYCPTAFLEHMHAPDLARIIPYNQRGCIAKVFQKLSFLFSCGWELQIVFRRRISRIRFNRGRPK